MIARMPQPSTQPLVLSDKLGLVALPDADSISAREEDLDRNAVRELLGSLGATLGMSLIRRDDGFPSAEADEAQAPADAPAFPDAAVRRSLEGLDAVWMREGEVVACFAVESGLAGWESVRRLADLLALHPKLKAPLYAVTLPSLKAGLSAELHRPVFLLPKKPLVETLRLLEWDKLRSEVEELGDRARYLKPEFLEGISEPLVAPKG
jgi:hypothetical protein